MGFPIRAESTDSTPISLVAVEDVEAFRADHPARSWIEATLPTPSAGDWAFLPGDGGAPSGVLAVVSNGQTRRQHLRGLARLGASLPEGVYSLAGDWQPEEYADAAWHWCAGTYRFGRYKEDAAQPPTLSIPGGVSAVESDLAARDLVRDLVNTPAQDLGPGELAEAARALAKEFGAELSVIEGDALESGYPMVAAVGRGASRAPRLVDLRWGDAGAPKLTLVGKGVCFDSGGLDLKPSNFMRNMKKDMGGSAHVLGLARMVMSRKLPVRLRMLIPAVENSVSGPAFRPGDVLRARNGKTVEIHNTDAEGRLILADALVDAAAEAPSLLLDMATLTGAARVALGPELPALFCDDDDVAAALVRHGAAVGEQLWRLPIHKPYRAMLDSGVADMTNCAKIGHAGSITAALFLAEFSEGAQTWVHVDLYAWNDNGQPGRSAGAEAQCLRTIVGYLEERFSAR